MKMKSLAAAMLLAVSIATISGAHAASGFAFGIGGRGGFIGGFVTQSHGWHDNDDHYDDYANDPNTAIRWHGRVDDTVTIFFQGTNVWQETNSGRQLNDGDFRVFQPLPSQPGNAYIGNAYGRGDIRVVQQPRPWNHFTTAVRIYDPQPSDSFYRFSLDFHPFDHYYDDSDHQWNGNALGNNGDNDVQGGAPQSQEAPPPGQGGPVYQDRGYNH
jgi:hypothetical protein